MRGERLSKRAGRAWPALAALVLLPACGHKGDPRPPLRRTPPAPTEFRLAQRGQQLLLEAIAPAASIDGVGYDTVTVEFLHGRGQVDLTRASREIVRVPAGTRAVATLPLPAPGTLVRAAARVVRGSERSPRTLTMALVAQAPIEAPRELAARLSGGGIDLGWLGERPKAVAPLPAPRVPGLSPLAARPAGPAGSGGTAPAAGAAPAPVPAPPAPGTPPPPAAAPAMPPPATPAPAAPAAAAPATPSTGSPAPGPGGASTGGSTAAGSGAPAPAGTAGPRRSGFFVYRRLGNGAYDRPLNPEPLDRRTLSDEGAPFGVGSCYVVRAVASTDPLIESAPSNEVCLERRDITPPESPAGLAVLPQPDGLELLWSPSTEEDLAGYRVYRSSGGGEPERLAELTPPGTASYLDTKVQKGVAYRYTLTAFDQAGNESPPCEPVEATLP